VALIILKLSLKGQGRWSLCSQSIAERIYFDFVLVLVTQA